MRGPRIRLPLLAASALAGSTANGGRRGRVQATAMLGAITLMTMAQMAGSSPVFAGPGQGNGSATISASFEDGCRDFVASSSKDISHVELRYADGRVVKDETIDRRDYAIDGAAGDEIDAAVVKSGTTSRTVTCPRNGPPTAVLELQTPPLSDCMYYPWPRYPTCLETDPRTTWSTLPGAEIAFIFIAPYPPATFSFRGVGSSDPDDDLATWSIDFGDGTSTSGSWATEPPTHVSHTFPSFSTNATVTLTVTDARGDSHASRITFFNHDGTPD